MKTLKEYLDLVETTLSQVSYPSWLPGLYEPIKYTMESGGKRLRPTLLLAATDAFGGNLSEAVWPATGIEIFHNFTLVHDDVMDQADMRRGRPTVCKKWDINTAILSGDAMVSMAYKCMASCPPPLVSEVIDRFGMMTMKVYEGQQIDADFETTGNVSFPQYIEMIIGKTSALIAYPLAIGSLIGGADATDIDLMFNFGVSLGIAFQMQDDYLDVYGDPATFGKSIGGDILNDKKTWLHIIARDRDSDGEFASVLSSGMTGPAKIAAVTAVYDRRGLREDGRKLIESYTSDAIDYLRRTAMPKEAKEWFENLAFRLMGRDK